ncbi:MAG: YdbL family protein [Planctomycetes bacterium]|nr:YdbL family protein [Planctomycetota bacterium]
MTRRTSVLIMLVTVLLGLFASPMVRADEKDDLKESFRKRHASLVAAKNEGKIGETAQGYVEAVKAADENAKELIAGENSDRRRLYAIIAKEQGATPETVAERNAVRNFREASKGHWLKGKDGKWFQKQ